MKEGKAREEEEEGEGRGACADVMQAYTIPHTTRIQSTISGHPQCIVITYTITQSSVLGLPLHPIHQFLQIL